MEGSDCNGLFSSDGMLNKVECIDIAGTYNAEETITATCTAQGESETVTMSGMGTVAIGQSGCSVSYVVPEFGVPRNGEVSGNNVSFAGSFVIPLAGGVNLMQNTATIEGTIVDENEIPFMGSGVATGTFEGVSFSCTGESTGVFKRCFDVAVAVLRGGPFPPFDIDIDSNISGIKDQATEVDPNLVIARDFRAFPGQLSRVGRWLDKINRGCDRQEKVVLIGYSAGGNAVRQANLSNMCSRITIDPIDPVEVALLNLDQRELILFPVSTVGRIINRLAANTSFLGLRGYRIDGADDEMEMADTSHLSILSSVRESSLVSDEVQGCLGN
jgi:hypothetical protein